MSGAVIIILTDPTPNATNSGPACAPHFIGALDKCDLEAARDAIDAKLSTLADKQCG